MQKINFNIQSLDAIFDSSDLTNEGSLVDQTYSILRKNIINLNLPPEMPLVEKEIAAILDISKTPVREAIIRLANDRLITVVAKSGSYVTAINLDRYLEACFIRVSLECGCVKRLAEKGISLAQQVELKAIITQQQQILEQQSIQKKLNEKIDYSPFFAVDELFHRTLFQCAGVAGAWKLMDSTKAELDRVRHLKKLMGSY